MAHNRVWAAAAAITLIVAGGGLAQPAAHADATGPLVAYDGGGDLYVVHADGTDPVELSDTFGEVGFHWSADGSTLLVQTGHSVESVRPDGSDLTTLFNTTTGEQTGGLAADPSGTYVLVTMTSSAQTGGSVDAALANGLAPDVTEQVATGASTAGPPQPFVDPANGQVFTWAEGSSAIQVVDGATTTAVDLGAGPLSWAAISPDGSELAFATTPTPGATAAYEVVGLSTTGTGAEATVTGVSGTPRVVAQAPAGAVPNSWTPDGAALEVSEPGGIVDLPVAGGAPTTVAPGVTGQLQPTAAPTGTAPLRLPAPFPSIPPGTSPLPPAITARHDGLVAWVNTSHQVVVAKNDGTDGHVLPIGEAADIAWSPDGSRLFVEALAAADGTDTITSVLPDGADPVTVAKADHAIGAFALDATGTDLVYGDDATNTLLAVRTDGSDPAAPTTAYDLGSDGLLGQNRINGIAFDPRNNLPIVDDTGQVYALGPNGASTLLVDLGRGDGVAVSPDGSELSFVSGGTNGVQLMVAPLAYTGTGAAARAVGFDGAPTPVASIGSFDLSLDQWTADGSTLVYEQGTSGGDSTWRVAPTGGTPTELTAFAGATALAYQPAGRGTPAYARLGVLGRDGSGDLWYYEPTGQAAAPLAGREEVGGGWQSYRRLVRAGDLSGDKQDDVLAVDGSGGLWLYQGTGNPAAPFAARVQVGHGWQIYTSVVGVGDVTGDGKPDVVAVDASGDQWLYRGTGNPAAPFAARVQIGHGWQIYKTIVGVDDVTGDGKPDLLAADASGVLWLYRGTGEAAAPFAARVRVGSGWQTYNSLVGVGDVTGDGMPDLVGRDPSGALWLYQGTGSAAAPFAARVQIGHGWQTYNDVF